MRSIYKFAFILSILLPFKSFAQNDYSGLERKVDSLQKKVDSILIVLSKKKIKRDYIKETKDQLDSLFANGVSITIDSACFLTENYKIAPVVFLTITNNSSRDITTDIYANITFINNVTNETLGSISKVICRNDLPLIANTHFKITISNSFSVGLSPATNLQTLNISGKIVLDDTYFLKKVQLSNKFLKKLTE